MVMNPQKTRLFMDYLPKTVAESQSRRLNEDESNDLQEE